MAIKDLAITSLETITVFDMAGNYLFTLDELQNASIAQGQEKVDITGKQGRKITSLKRNKTVTVSGTNGLMSTGLLGMQVGSQFADGSYDVVWTDVTMKVIATKDTDQKVTALHATPQFKPKTGNGELCEIWVKDSDGRVKKKLTYTTEGSPSAGKFTITTTTSGNAEITTINFFIGTTGTGALPADVADGDELVAYYIRTMSGSKLENFSDKYSDKGQIYIDAIAEDTCANVYHVQYYIPKGDFNGEFEFSMGDDQTVHAFEIEALAGGCNGSSAFWTLTVFGEDE